MIAIVNVTIDDSQELDDYEVRINKRVLTTFQHKRGIGGAARCLREAADAIDRENAAKLARYTDSFVNDFIENLKK